MDAHTWPSLQLGRLRARFDTTLKAETSHAFSRWLHSLNAVPEAAYRIKLAFGARPSHRSGSSQSLHAGVDVKNLILFWLLLFSCLSICCST